MKRLINSGIGRARAAGRWLRNKMAATAPILIYHRVADVPSDPQLLCVSPKHFAEHLEVLRKYAQPESLQNFVTTLQNGNMPRRAVAITFDDGYADNLINAKPLLTQYDVPATVFVITGYIGQMREFWWDDLERVLLQPNTLPQSLNIAGQQWALGKAATNNQTAYWEHRGWNVLEKNDPTPRHTLYRSLHRALLNLSEPVQQKNLQALQTKAGMGSTARTTHRPLTTEEVIKLAADGLVEVGAHTVTHPVLSQFPLAVQQDEIQRSKKHLEDILNRTVTSFSYPYGSRATYTAQTISLVREAGFRCACANVQDVVWQSRVWGNSDCYQLPRILVRNWDGDEFAKRLQAFLV
ncbi:MAG: polysaccharide deacetylase family protein [Candidatus Parabeggiatoa sp.]|nr:polysaccharide deacetylase family protein [Candidatus Parabeggiatoa sp.]